MGWGSLGEETDLAVSRSGIKDNRLVFKSPNDSRRMMMETNGENPTVGSRRYLCYCTLGEDHLWLLGTGCTHTVTIRKLIMENAEVSFPSPASLGSTLQFHLPSNVTGQCGWLRLLPCPRLSDLSIPQAARHVSPQTKPRLARASTRTFSMDHASQQTAQGD